MLLFRDIMDDYYHYSKKNEDKSAQALAAGAIVTSGIENSAAIIRDLLKASMTNPLIGAVTGLVMSDLLLKMKIIDPNTASGIKIMIFAAAGIALTSELIADVTNIFKIGDSVTTNDKLLTPSANVIVFSDGDKAQLNALLQNLAAKVNK